MGIIGDHIYLKALQDHELSYFKLSKYFFPFDKEILVSEGLMLIRNKINNETTYKALKDALRYDPYSIEMLSMQVQFENAYGDKNKAKQMFNLLKQIGSNTNTFKELKKLETMKGF